MAFDSCYAELNSWTLPMKTRMKVMARAKKNGKKIA